MVSNGNPHPYTEVAEASLSVDALGGASAATAAATLRARNLEAHFALDGTGSVAVRVVNLTAEVDVEFAVGDGALRAAGSGLVVYNPVRRCRLTSSL